MCGRAHLSSDVSEIKVAFRIPPERPAPNRMPAILAPEAWPEWLGEEPAHELQLKSLLAPYPSEAMICWPVSARVGNVRNNDSSLIEPVATA